MAIEFRCWQCGRLLRVGEEWAGRPAQCPQCGQTVTVPGISAATTPPPMATPSPFSSGEQNPYQASAAPLGPMSTPSGGQSGKATAALILGIIGLGASLSNLCCGLLFFVSVPCSIAGLILGMMARKSPDKTNAMVGIVLSAIALVISLAYVVLIVVMLVLGAAQQHAIPR
jgi:hypothetical protein